MFVGDGAGVGKGRTVAGKIVKDYLNLFYINMCSTNNKKNYSLGIIYENYLRGRKRSIWLSVSNDLRFDAIRDLNDVGCHAKVTALNKVRVFKKINYLLFKFV